MKDGQDFLETQYAKPLAAIQGVQKYMVPSQKERLLLDFCGRLEALNFKGPAHFPLLITTLCPKGFKPFYIVNYCII